MSKKCYHFFGGLLNAQANWLNKMSEKGYRLIRAGKMLYEFEECKPNEVKYCVEFIGEKSKENANDYFLFLEDMGYKVFFKNINLNYSVGKVRWRPWAEKGGRIATNATTFNRELLIVEKENDGKPFELHTSYDDKENYYRNLRNPWLLILLMFAIFAVINHSVVFGVLALISLIPVLVYQIQIDQIYPDISDFFDFVDMKENYPFTGTGNLYNFCVGLCRINIQNNIIAIFDNDTAGLEKYHQSQSLQKPDSFVITKLPDCPEFSSICTLGPQGSSMENINGRAVAIECFLDFGSVQKSPCVRWTSYNKNERQYQGELESKDEYVRAFKQCDLTDGSYDTSKLEFLIEYIISQWTDRKK